MTNWRDPDESDYRLPSRPAFESEAEVSSLDKSPSNKNISSLSLSLIAGGLAVATCSLFIIGLYLINTRLSRIENLITQSSQSPTIEPSPFSSPDPTDTPIPSPTFTDTPIPSPTSTSTPAFECPQNLPSPQLALRGVDQLDFGARYRLTVINRDQFPKELFAPAPNLPSCGVNVNSSRTWLAVFGDNNRSQLFCDIGSVEDLDDIWFITLWEAGSPSAVYIEMVDRQCNNSYTSNIVTLQ